MKKQKFAIFWSKMVQKYFHGNLKIGYMHFFYGNPILIKIEDSVKWGKIAPPIRTLRIYSCFVKKILNNLYIS